MCLRHSDSDLRPHPKYPRCVIFFHFIMRDPKRRRKTLEKHKSSQTSSKEERVKKTARTTANIIAPSSSEDFLVFYEDMFLELLSKHGTIRDRAHV
jgi:hypothetical protein